MLRRFTQLALGAAALSIVAFAGDPDWIARSKTGMLAADSPEASRIGADVLTAGGNAFDAAVATSLALAVARPQSTGLGGGGFMVAYVAKDKRFVALDFREVAPAAATAERYAELLKRQGDGPSPTIYGGSAIAVPGQVAGLAEIHKRFGTRPWKDLVAPAIKLAQTGFVADEHHVNACNAALKDMEKWPPLKERHARLYATLLGNGVPPNVGDKVMRPDLALALQLIADRGPDAFYQGPIADAVVKAAQAAGGVLTKDDLATYKVREREPLRAKYHDYEIVAMPPPSSGGVCIIEVLNALDALRDAHRELLPKQDFDWKTDAGFPLMLVYCLQHAFADRARWLGDPDFARVPVAYLTSSGYAKLLAARGFSWPGAAARPEEYGTNTLPEDRGTSHFCVADRDGNIVALTETINGTFGSFVVAEPYGIILNNQMDDFAAEPGQPNLYGLIQGQANAIAPGKHPLSSMAPTIVLKAGRPVLVLGASGGPRIITSVLQVMLNVIEFDVPLEQAMTAVRLHHQWLPDEVAFDREPPAELAKVLKDAGYKLTDERKSGKVQAIQFLPGGTMVGASDPQKGGRPAGVTGKP